MIFVDQLGLLWFPKVKCVALAIFVSYDEVHGLLWIPANGGRFVFQVDFVDWGVAANIIKTNASVLSHTGEQIDLAGIEFDLIDCVDTPFKTLHG